MPIVRIHHKDTDAIVIAYEKLSQDYLFMICKLEKIVWMKYSPNPNFI